MPQLGQAYYNQHLDADNYMVLTTNNKNMVSDFYPTSGKIPEMWLAKRKQILYCIWLPIIPHWRYIKLM